MTVCRPSNGVAVVALAAALSLASCGAAPPGDRFERQPTNWSVLALSADQRVLKLSYATDSSCERADGRADVTETPDAVAVRVTRSVLVDAEPGTICDAITAQATLEVRLPRPLAGRRIDGGAIDADGAERGVMPNLIGFNEADALVAASRVSPRIIISSRVGSAVVRQRPPAGYRGDPGRGTGRAIPEVRLRLGAP